MDGRVCGPSGQAPALQHEAPSSNPSPTRNSSTLPVSHSGQQCPSKRGLPSPLSGAPHGEAGPAAWPQGGRRPHPSTASPRRGLEPHPPRAARLSPGRGGDCAAPGPYRFLPQPGDGPCRGGHGRGGGRGVAWTRVPGAPPRRGAAPLRARGPAHPGGPDPNSREAGRGRRRRRSCDRPGSGGASRPPAPAPPGRCSPGPRDEPGECGDRRGRGLAPPGLCDLARPGSLSGRPGSRRPFAIPAWCPATFSDLLPLLASVSPSVKWRSWLSLLFYGRVEGGGDKAS
jgi:hypothetical protein